MIDFDSSVLAKKVAGKIVSKMTYLCGVICKTFIQSVIQ